MLLLRADVISFLPPTCTSNRQPPQTCFQWKKGVTSFPTPFPSSSKLTAATHCFWAELQFPTCHLLTDACSHCFYFLVGLEIGSAGEEGLGEKRLPLFYCGTWGQGQIWGGSGLAGQLQPGIVFILFIVSHWLLQ